MSKHNSDPDPFPVILEDDSIHLEPYYFCATDDPTCPCREDPELIDHVAQEYDAGLLTSLEADRIVGGRQVNS
mgnify:CR=1 FL=1